MVFLFLLIIVFIIILILTFSKIRLEIINLEISSQNIKHIKQDYKIVLRWCILKKIPIAKIVINKEKLDKPKIREKFGNINLKIFEDAKKMNKEKLKNIKKMKIEIKNINLKVDIGTEDAGLTSMIVPIIGTAIALFLRKKIKYNPQNHFFIITPIYLNQNYLNIKVSGIFEIKINHIINIMYLLKRKGEDKYERTSNRRSYDYSYE